MNRIICIGNRYVQGDEFGARVYVQLLERVLPDYVQVIDGGIAGLNLLMFFDGCERLVFVDSLAGDNSLGDVHVLEEADLLMDETNYSHASGLGYLLEAALAIRDHSAPRIFLVGAGAQANQQAVATAADLCSRLVLDR
jgi:hydrogenase maturation protease